MTLQEMVMRLEKGLLHHCAPTLAGLKPASMFTCRVLCDGCKSCHCSQSKIDAKNALLEIALAMCRGKLSASGVKIAIVAWRSSGPLLFVYRQALLERTVADTRTAAFLQQLGYDTASASACITRLVQRIAASDALHQHERTCAFPHEVGLLLGYPFEDVMGFIQHNGCSQLLSGCWKVYSNASDAQDCFCRYKQCRKTLVARYLAGAPIEKLAMIGCAA